MTKAGEDYFLNPPPGSAAARAVEFGIDLTLTNLNLRLTPEQRIWQLESFIRFVTELRKARTVSQRDAIAGRDN
jgi:hypothetical protein